MRMGQHSHERRRLASPRALLAAEEILSRWSTGTPRAPLDWLVQSELRVRRHLNSAERRWIADAIFGSVRFWRRQTWILNNTEAETGARQRIELWARGPHAHEGGDFTPFAELPGPDCPAKYLRETLSFPDEMAEALEAVVGSEAVAAAEAFNAQAPTTLRINTLRATRARVLERNPEARPTRFSPWGVELDARVNVRETPGFRDGWFEVQEEASQLVALLTDARPGQTVVDMGAGAGGKSLALAAMMQNKGVVISADTAKDRLARIQQRATRGGVKIIRPLTLSADSEGNWQLSGEEARSVDRLRKHADCVLVDAPCSGSGVLRRSPDAKWRPNNLIEYARLQALLLEQSAAFVAHGGCLVYATCAFERVQNEAVVEQFLRSGAGKAFEIVPVLGRLKSAVGRAAAKVPGNGGAAPEADLQSLTSGPFLRTWPHRHNLDAFFAACFVRTT